MKLLTALTTLFAIMVLPDSAQAYIGPGAGFAFLGSTLVFVVTIFLAIATLALWPFQLIIRRLRGLGVSRKARTRRVVIVGLDGLEPKLAEQYMSEGKLPNLKALADQGSYQRLGTTLPSLSPVAWSTFQTGVNPGAHNIFDFLTRDKRFCMPQMASTETVTARRSINLGVIKIPFGKTAKVTITRKSQPFWKILGKYGIFSNVLRVPISYPPEPFYGNILSAMCTPDLKGTQGSFSFYTTRATGDSSRVTGGDVKVVKREGDTIHSEIEGPPDPKQAGKFLRCPFSITVNQFEKKATLQIGGKSHLLKLEQFSPWIEVEFPFGFRKQVSGIVRFCLREISPEFSLYASPVNINPEKPCLPIARPIFFATWLAKRLGLFGTLGLMEDTWGRNEHALDDRRFLDQSYLNHAEREKMFMDALDRTREGLCACVFDASDRIQHMFWRYLDPKHPSPREDSSFDNTIPEMYKKMDELVGRVRAKLNPNDVIIILSDHGFTSFRRCINLNSWLYENGYLAVKEKPTGADYFKDVDWSRTKAYAVGLSGIFINRKGREVNGIVSKEDAEKLKLEISAKLEDLKDSADGARSINKVFDTAKAYRGLYTNEAPDLIIGYLPGYRVSWDSITGAIEPTVFSDNLKAWSGDHHVDPSLIPGILFTNRKLKVTDPNIIDIAPTTLDLFAVKVPKYMEGRVVL